MKAHYVFVFMLLSLTACDSSSVRAGTDSGEKVPVFTETIKEKVETANDQGIGAAGHQAFLGQVTCRHIGGFQHCHFGTCPQGETWVKNGCP
ncbi:MAG: hypothetical protein MN733_08565 [Nitrososphaera sp.]|nr:hypothetical protein [Nitrososphaera sp.]